MQISVYPCWSLANSGCLSHLYCFGRRLAGQQLAQYILQNSAMLIVQNLLWSIDSYQRAEFSGAAVSTMSPYLDLFAIGKFTCQQCRKTQNVINFIALEPQALRVFLSQELQRQYAHAHKVGAMDALIAFCDDRANP